jgi:4,5-DOPA dioxygenase extradiol
MDSLPALFISHGSPTLAIDPGETGPALRALGQSLPRPQAVLVASAHWETEHPAVSGASQPETIHDFGGFPEELFRIQYPARGASVLAKRACGLLAAAGFVCAIDPARGLDHGAWVPLRYLYPEADVPVLQVSIQPHQTPRHHYRMGEALAPLREEGVLVIGSGSITHNLREVRWRGGGPTPEWVDAFRTWMAETIERGDQDAFLAYRAKAPHAARNHPTDEHLLPLFVAAGAGRSLNGAQRLHDAVTLGVLGMDIYLFGDSQQATTRAA